MVPDWFSYVDLTYAGVVLLFAWGGSQKGFAAQIAHLLALLVMGLALFFVYPFCYSLIGRHFRELDATYTTWFLLTLLLVLTVGAFIGFQKLAAKVIHAKVSDRTDKIWGFILGLGRGLIAALFAMVFLVILNPARFYDAFRMKAQTGRLVCYEMVPRIQPRFTRPVMQEKVDKLRNILLQRDEAGNLE